MRMRVHLWTRAHAARPIADGAKAAGNRRPEASPIGGRHPNPSHEAKAHLAVEVVQVGQPQAQEPLLQARHLARHVHRAHALLHHPGLPRPPTPPRRGARGDGSAAVRGGRDASALAWGRGGAETARGAAAAGRGRALPPRGRALHLTLPRLVEIASHSLQLTSFLCSAGDAPQLALTRDQVPAVGQLATFSRPMDVLCRTPSTAWIQTFRRAASPPSGRR